jgi:high-affinity iron transporter
MLPIALIVFRETLEAALFVGIIAAATRGIALRSRWISFGVGAGIIGSLIIAAMAAQISQLAEGIGQDLLNAMILALAFLMLAWHVISAARHGKHAAGEAKQLGQSLHRDRGIPWTLIIAIALAILREGAETVLFVAGFVAGNSDTGSSAALTNVTAGTGAGLITGCAVGVALYLGLSRIPVRRLFSVTNTMVLLLAAAMASQLARSLTQAGLIPSLADPAWSTNRILSMDSPLGTLMHALVGYDARPSGMQVVFYLGGVAIILIGMRLMQPAPRALVPA